MKLLPQKIAYRKSLAVLLAIQLLFFSSILTVNVSAQTLRWDVPNDNPEPTSFCTDVLSDSNEILSVEARELRTATLTSSFGPQISPVIVTLSPPEGNSLELSIPNDPGLNENQYRLLPGESTSPPITVHAGARVEVIVIPWTAERDGQLFSTGAIEVAVFDIDESTLLFGLVQTSFFNLNPENPSLSCYDLSNTSNLQISPQKMSYCGTPATGLTADGSARIGIKQRIPINGVITGNCVSPSFEGEGSGGVIPVFETFNGTEWVRWFEFGLPEYNLGPSIQSAVNVTFQMRYLNSIIEKQTTIFRPSTALVHGLWGDNDYWYKDGRPWLDALRQNYEVHPVSYAPHQAGSFEDASKVLSVNLQNMIRNRRVLGIATERANVVAYSMGGPVTRYMVNNVPEYRNQSNKFRGQISSLVTLASPHDGSVDANYAIALSASLPISIAWSENRKKPIDRGAICDLAENSPAISKIDWLFEFFHSIVASGGTVGKPCPEYPIDRGLYTFNVPNDCIVSADSQNPWFDGFATTNYQGLVHGGESGITQSTVAAQNTVQRMVEFGVDDDEFYAGSAPPSISDSTGAVISAPGQPDQDPAIYQLQCTNDGPLTSSSQKPEAGIPESVIINSPLEGEMVLPNTTVSVELTWDQSITASQVVLAIGTSSSVFENGPVTPPVTLNVPLSPNEIGNLDVLVGLVDSNDGLHTSVPTTIFVMPEEQPVEINTDQVVTASLDGAILSLPGSISFNGGLQAALSDLSSAITVDVEDTNIALFDGAKFVINNPGQTMVNVNYLGITSSFMLDVVSGDSDSDGYRDDYDNCSEIPNEQQVDSDGDGIGNFCDPDVNNDCAINFVDISLFSQGYLGTDPNMDFNSDGNINFIDLQILSEMYLAAPGPSGLSTCTIPLLQDSFDTGLSDWSLGFAVSYQSTGGNTGGYLKFDDPGMAGGAFVYASNQYLGDWSVYDNSANIEFDHAIFSASPPFIPLRITLTGPGGVAMWTGQQPIGASNWSRVSVPIASTMFEMQSGTWQDLLAGISSLSIKISASSTNIDITGLDNFAITQ